MPRGQTKYRAPSHQSVAAIPNGPHPAEICRRDWEWSQVRELRQRGVSWQHIAAQLGRHQATLRAIYG